MKILQEIQCVGDGQGFSRYRRLIEKDDGSRVSIPLSDWFWIADIPLNQRKEHAEKAKLNSLLFTP